MTPPINVLTSGPIDGPPVLLIHGNCSSGAYWAPLQRLLPAAWRTVVPDLRGYGGSPALPVDATRGLRDLADDVVAVLDDPQFFPAGSKPVVVGHSMGGGVAMQVAIERPDRIGALLLEAPLAPYGFGGTRDVHGTPTTPDHAGTGGGSVNPEFVKRLAAGDRTTDDQASPLNVMRGTYVADPAAFGDDEQALLDSMLSTAVGEDNYPGDGTTSDNWPMIAPGTRGILNAMSPAYLNLSGFADLPVKPPVVWVRGDADVIVSDTSLFDLAYLGKIGAVPGWPGDEAAPPQPMIGQIRHLLDRYTAGGGSYEEIVYAGVGHSPHVERAADFAAVLQKLRS